MLIKWIGHSCFKFVNKAGVEIIVDPFDNTVGYEPLDEKADIVLSSHDHFDHNYIAGIKEGFKLIDKAGSYEECGIKIEGFELCHDDENGAKRGKTVAYKLYIDGMTLLHMGDVGIMPDDDFFEKIGKIDFLMIPVGGVYTIDAKGALEIMEKIMANITIPMHYMTASLSFDLKGIFEFTDLAGREFDISRLGSSEYSITADDLKKRCRIMLMEHAN